MLNKDNERELAYVVRVGGIDPIEGYDKVEVAHVLGWTVLVRKDQFRVGDLAIYIEIDSKTPETEPFTFLEKYHYKVKTQRFCKGTVISQGLLMSPEDFGWEVLPYEDDTDYIVTPEVDVYGAGDFLTQRLGITYAVEEDNRRKAPPEDKYKKMARRHIALFSRQPFKWLMRRDWGKKLLFLFFGRMSDKKNGWPSWVKKTDEERLQGCPWVLKDKCHWFATEKIDGTSTTFTMKRKRHIFGEDRDFRVCSRNVCLETPGKECYYDSNVYWQMAEKYDIRNVLEKMLSDYPVTEFITIQGETYGKGVQKRDYNHDVDFMAFNLIFGYRGGEPVRFNPRAMKNILDGYAIPSVPIVSEGYVLPDTVEEVLEFATGESVIDGGPREGVVFRNADGTKSFKAVSNEYLLQYHS